MIQQDLYSHNSQAAGAYSWMIDANLSRSSTDFSLIKNVCATTALPFSPSYKRYHRQTVKMLGKLER